jgi:hypothetical protein
MWLGFSGGAATAYPMRSGKSRGVWTLYWRDSDGGWHVYRDIPPTATIDDLLREVDRDPTAIFWG